MGFASVIGLSNLIPVSLLVYGLASFITGGTTKYYPSLVGALICFACAAIALNVGFAWQNLICAAAVFAVHVIPGLIMLRKNARRGYAQ